MLKQLSILLILVSVALSIQMERRELSAETVVLAENRAGFHRVLAVTGLPTIEEPHTLSITGANAYGTAVLDNDELSGDISLNTATFNVQTPQTGNDLTFYFGFLKVDAEWSLNSASAFGSISGSLAEVIASFYSIIVYEDRDGNPGFQYQLGQDVLDCTGGEDFDCVRLDEGFTINLNELTWSPITHTTVNCTADLEAPIDGEQCTVTTWTIATTDNAVIFDFKTTSHPVTVEERTLDPDSAKIDISINYDWTGITCDNCKLALTAATAGKMVSGSLSFAIDNSSGTTTTNFEADGGISAFISWDTQAAIVGETSTVYYHAVKYGDLDAWTCDPNIFATSNNCLSATAILNVVWKLALGVWQAFGWDGTVLVFSWADVKPSNVFWDPQVGGNDPSRITDDDLPEPTKETNASSALFLSFLLYQLMMLLW